ncbi:hypothetical protein Thimo_2664 [Thioflavicoccus mobilis 8321]|uniref:Uncharacterized protein n=1 Tax=Thioflavicoccus mobilis 8321 TaxID=765912 RepID=L0GX88_9GAMM|nr:hypothetical protein Thimo_2664 [Thioflavicoccus mobilis 8321]
MHAIEYHSASAVFHPSCCQTSYKILLSVGEKKKVRRYCHFSDVTRCQSQYDFTSD